MTMRENFELFETLFIFLLLIKLLSGTVFGVFLFLPLTAKVSLTISDSVRLLILIF